MMTKQKTHIFPNKRDVKQQSLFSASELNRFINYIYTSFISCMNGMAQNSLTHTIPICYLHNMAKHTLKLLIKEKYHFKQIKTTSWYTYEIHIRHFNSFRWHRKRFRFSDLLFFVFTQINFIS